MHQSIHRASLLQPALSGAKVDRLVGIKSMIPVLSAWQHAAERAEVPLPYCGPIFVTAMLSAYHATQSPVLVVASRDDQIDGLLPLVERPLRRLGQTVREVGFPFNPNSIVNAPPVSCGDASATDTLADLLNAAFSSGAETLILDHLPDPLADTLAAAAKRIGARSDPPSLSRALHYARLDGSWDNYLSGRSRNHRWQIRKVLKAADAPDVTIERVFSREALTAALPDWFAVESASWQGTDPTSAMDDDDRSFHALLINSLPDDQLGDLWIVRFSGRPVAALRMLATPGQVSVHTMHFDAAEREHAPGLLAFAFMMRSACEQGLNEVDFHGTTDFFARWATGTRSHRSIRIYRPGLRGVALQNCRRVIRGLRLESFRQRIPR